MITDKPLKILGETEKFVVIDKPINLEVHASGSTENTHNTVQARIRHQLNDDALHLCHRLDRVTSGLLLMAKGATANSEISQLFQDRLVSKFYIAVSDQKPKKKQGSIKGDMQKARNGSWKLARSHSNPAVTRFFSFGLGTGKRLFVLKPETGKTHQLRVAMKSLGAPILGDTRYGGTESDRCYLHAYSLGFNLDGVAYYYQSLPQEGDAFQAESLVKCIAGIGDFSELSWPHK
jgi:pseudouridine synthase Rlu family protein, TIGR01621